MAARYTLKILADFASAHTLRDYPGACARMHGHNWKVEVEVVAEQLDDVGMGLDFKVIKQAARGIAARLDHRYLNDLEPSPGIRVHAVTLWETERACVRYVEDQS